MAALGRGVPEDLGDPLLQTWQLAWGAHALLRTPLHPWDANTFWPLPDSLAFSDALYGYAPAGALFGGGPTAALWRYGVLFLLSYALAVCGGYALARSLGARPAAAAVAGVGYAFAPWHLAQDGHLHILANGGLPLALALLVRGHRRHRPGPVVAGWAVAAWQLTLGFGVGLQLAYLLALCSAAGAAYAVAAGRVDRRLLRADVAGAVLFVGVGLAFAAPYLRVVHDHPEARRTVADLRLFSPPPRGLLLAPADSTVWGGLQAGPRAALPFPPEMTLAPGGVLLGLAVFGALRGRTPRTWRVLLAGTAATSAVMALGTSVAGGRFSYLLLFEHAPGWDGVRTPGRLVLLTTLALALLAALGADRLPRRAAVLLAAAVALEGHGALPTPDAPPVPASLRQAAGPVLVLPSDDVADPRAMFASTAGLYPMVNGTSGFVPVELARLRRATAAFPDRATVDLLRRLGVRTVVLRPEEAAGTPWARAAGRSVVGLPVDRREVDGTLVFTLR